LSEFKVETFKELVVSFQVFEVLEVFDTMALDCTKANIIVATFGEHNFKELVVGSSFEASCIEVWEVCKLIVVVVVQSLPKHMEVEQSREEIKIHE
jgi:hypothetical protein